MPGWKSYLEAPQEQTLAEEPEQTQSLAQPEPESWLDKKRRSTALEALERVRKIPSLQKEAKARLSPEAYSNELGKSGKIWDINTDVNATAGRYGATDILKSLPVVNQIHTLTTGLEEASKALPFLGRATRNTIQAGIDPETEWHPLDAALDSAKGSSHELLQTASRLKDKSIGANVVDSAASGVADTFPLNLTSGFLSKDTRRELGTDLATDPLNYFSLSGEAKPALDIPKQVKSIFSASGIKDAKLVEQIGAEAAKLYQTVGGQAHFPKLFQDLLTSAGADETALSNVVGPAAEFVGKKGVSVGLPGFADRGVELGPLVTSAIGGRVPEHALGRLSELGARKLPGQLDAPFHTRAHVGDELTKLAHGGDKYSLMDETTNMGLSPELEQEVLHRGNAIARRKAVPYVDPVLQHFKKTALFGKPAFLPMNTSEDIGRSLAGGNLDPRTAGQARKVFNEAIPPQQALTKTGQSVGDVRALVRSHGIDEASGIGQEGSEAAAPKSWKDWLPFQKGDRLADALTMPVPQSVIRKAAETEGKYAKTSFLIDKLNKGESPILAAKRVRDTFHDNAVPSLNKHIAQLEPVAKRMVPFSGYLGRSAISIPRLLAQNPAFATVPEYANQAMEKEADPSKAPLYARNRGPLTSIPRAGKEMLGKVFDKAEVPFDPSYDYSAQLRGLDLREPISWMAEPFGDTNTNAPMMQHLAPIFAELATGTNQVTGEQESLSPKPFWPQTPFVPESWKANEGEQPVGAGVLGGALTGQAFQMAVNELARKYLGTEGPVIGGQGQTLYNGDTDEKNLMTGLRLMTGSPIYKHSPMQEAWDITESPPVQSAVKTKKAAFKQDIVRSKKKKKP